MELLNKLSMKGIGAVPKRNELAEGEKKRVAVIFGRAHKYEVGNSQYGEFTKFKGTFEAQNIATGQTYKSGAVFLPSVVEELLKSAIDGAEDAAVDFALAIGVTWSDNAVGYTYTVEPLTETRESDELAALRQVALQALPAPAAKSDEPAGETGSKGKKK